jgi:hypothetical protein
MNNPENEKQIVFLHKASDCVLSAMNHLSLYACNLSDSKEDQAKLEKAQQLHDALWEVSSFLRKEFFARIKAQVLSEGAHPRPKS